MREQNLKESFRHRVAKSRQRGLTLIETALALGVMALIVASLSMMMADSAEQTRARAAADKVIEVHEASKGYVKANFAALLAQTSGGPVTVPSGRQALGGAIPGGPGGLPSLQSGGYLPSSYVDSNGYGQRHSLVVKRHPQDSNKLEALVSTHGGREIPDRQLGRIANMVGAAGGFVPSVNVNPADAGQVVGSYGGWRTPVGDWGAAARPAVGHVSATLAFEDGNLLADYLYRNDIGNPEANRMRTNIDMYGNSLESVDELIAGANGRVQVRGDARVTQDLFAQRDISAGRNLAVEGTSTLRGNVTAERNLTVQRDATVQRNLRVQGASTLDGDVQANGNLTVAGLTRTNDLKATYLDIDSIVYTDRGDSRGLSKGQGIRLGDLLPRNVHQYSYRVVEGQAIPKPSCRRSNGAVDRDLARIYLLKQTDSNRGTTVVPLRVTRNDGYVTGVSQPSPATVDIVDTLYARDNGLTWTALWAGSNPVPGTPRAAVALTTCFYGP